MLSQKIDKFVMIEEFVDGIFQKYINNDGTLNLTNSSLELQAKVECLAHYSFVKSKETLIILDIQGCGYTLFDPEIASLHSNTDNGVYLFGMGNLSGFF